ncbi:hypothetical protein BDZ45DRAFT_754215 [Acephala macrosclerotiorum]|nr:hypothetical protein BDZ45DRAFT_754215 [Acephala macrosclerotiorum]
MKKLLFIVRQGLATQPQDRLYDILSLVDHTLAEMVKPDYTLKASEDLVDFAKTVIEWTEESSVIVDASEKIRFNANKGSEGVSSFDDHKLLARGLVIDKVDGLGVPWSTSDSSTLDEYERHNLVQSSKNLNPCQGTKAK